MSSPEKLKIFEIQISQSPLTLVIRDAGRRTQSTCGGGGGRASSHLWCPNRHSLSSSYFLFFFFLSFSNQQEANQINIHFETL